jgi:hypothetical protein
VSRHREHISRQPCCKALATEQLALFERQTQRVKHGPWFREHRRRAKRRKAQTPRVTRGQAEATLVKRAPQWRRQPSRRQGPDWRMGRCRGGTYRASQAEGPKKKSLRYYSASLWDIPSSSTQIGGASDSGGRAGLGPNPGHRTAHPQPSAERVSEPVSPATCGRGAAMSAAAT